MEYILLAFAVLFMSSQSIFQKQYNIKAKSPDGFLYTSLSSFFAFMMFLVSSGFKPDFTLETIPYSLAFALCYAMSVCGSVFAIRYGSMAITMLINSYSLVVPTVYGMIFLNEKISMFAVVGIILLCISLFMLNFKKEENKFSIKWIICIIISFTGGGMCSTVQKIQQVSFDGGYKNEFMIVAMAAVSLAMLLLALRRKHSVSDIKTGLVHAAPNGVANGLLNLFVMILTGMIPNAVLFPSISSGGIVIGFIVAVFVYREKLAKIQISGYAAGIAALILLNI